MIAYTDIKRLVSIISAMREPFDHHGSRTAPLAMNLAIALRLPLNDVELIETGAELHDIGKVFIGSELLNANRKLSSVERADMEKHTTLGWTLVNEAGYDQIVQDIIRHHHERWDGKGYPDGLKGNNIPVCAQIVGICDCYEAMTSKRPYRESYSHQFVMAFIQKDKGTRFNPELVDLFFTKVVPHG